MQSMIFQVSAKTARLIGRENISDVNGAIIELIKNGYDADAECVYVKFVNPYNEIPPTLTQSEVKKFFKQRMDLIENNYTIFDGKYNLNKIEKCGSYSDLEYYIRSLSKIIVIDNGNGMSRDVLETSWMKIGTDDKEINIYSPQKKRIKTGAKGIGRFALDKLSLKSKVITKNKNDKTYEWKIDWTQFDDVNLLNQVSATLEEVDTDFEQVVKSYTQDDFDSLKVNNWTTGTLIELSPIRDFWETKSYLKVNDSLKNINPFESVDRFDIVVRNLYCPQFDFYSEKEGIERENYDYLIEANFDGKGTVQISFDRNEIDINKTSTSKEYSPTDIETYDHDEFWNKEIFNRKKYTKESFDGKVDFIYSLKEILENKKENYEKYNEVGPFSLKFYYLKNSKSTVEIIKDFKSRKRKELIKNFAGIKLYRDNFKVRPYGDKGQFFDWLNLSERVQRSPAAASHESGNWRVSPNQLIGSVSISRINNPALEDSANREGINSSREYECFIEIIQGILSKFEFDRQYVLREYANWIRGKEKKHRDKAQEIYEQVSKERGLGNKANIEKENVHIFKNQIHYSQMELKDAIYVLGKEKENRTSTEQLMMVLSAAGVMAQTFAHEISRVATNLGSRGQHLKEAINRLLNYEPYMGDEDFNPYDMIDELNATDEILSEWVSLIMDSVQKDKFQTKTIELKSFLEHTKKIWTPLLNKKYIKIQEIECSDLIELKLPEVDLHLILNNFILNSAYYLEEIDGERIITIRAYEDEKHIYLEMKNNGPILDEKYWQNPDETLNAQESSKEDGTGLGLWIAREAVNRNDGNLHVILIDSGYMLKATWTK